MTAWPRTALRWLAVVALLAGACSNESENNETADATKQEEGNMQVNTSVKDLEEVVQQYHAALDAFVRGRPEPMKALFSHAADVVLANPFGPAVQGWDNASAALDYASSRFSDGEAAGFDRMASYVTPDLATIYEVEHGNVSVGGGTVTGWLLRTTTTFRREDGTWKVVHRHADPISTDSSEGPLRAK
jgi:ketosteroid isomerase-like protein